MVGAVFVEVVGVQGWVRDERLEDAEEVLIVSQPHQVLLLVDGHPSQVVFVVHLRDFFLFHLALG